MQEQTVYFKLTRDQARVVQQNFFPYLVQLCETRILDNETNIIRQLQERSTKILLLQVCKIFDRKLIGVAQKMKFDIELPNAIAFYTLLQLMPISGTEIFLINLRSYLVNVLHQQLLSPAPISENLNLASSRYQTA